MKHINNPLRSEGKLNIVVPRTRSNIFTQVDQDHPGPSGGSGQSGHPQIDGALTAGGKNIIIIYYSRSGGEDGLS